MGRGAERRADLFGECDGESGGLAWGAEFEDAGG